MIDTSRITSSFDIEFQLGSGWFSTALRGLHERGLLIPPGTIPFIPEDTVITIDFVDIIFDPSERDINIELTIGDIITFSIQASISLSDDGKELVLDTTLNNLSSTVPFDALSGLAGTLEIVKLRGDEEREHVICILANMDIRASSQSGGPLDPSEHLERGNIADAQSFLPKDKHVALGIADTTLSRFANDIWHSQLTNDEGGQPFPDDENEQGDWQSVSMTISDGKIRVTLKAVVEVDSPIIDIIPDPDITITVDLTPNIDNGKLTFEITLDASIDFGILGDILAALVGGLIGFVIGLFAGNPIAGALVGAGAGVIVLEVGEVIAGNAIAKEIKAQIDGKPLAQFYSCKNEVVHLATIQDQGQGLNLGFLDALPTSIPISFDSPDPLHKRTVLVSTSFDAISINSDGFAVEGDTLITERYTPENATIINKTRVQDDLLTLAYRTTDGTEVNLTLEEILARANADDVQEPLKVFDSSEDDLVENKKDGKIPVACMHPIAIHREETIITDIRFSTGLELKTEETILLQDAGALILPNLQLIHPSNANPYYRVKADDSIENNFESLPEF